MLMMMRSDSSYTPTEGCTAEELLKCLTADDYDACIATCSSEAEEEEVANGFVTISKVSAAATQEVAYNATKKNVGTIKLKAGEDGAVISSVVVKRSGLGNNIASIQLASTDGAYITAARRVGATDGEAVVRFSPALELKANQSMNFDVLVSLNGTVANANETHTFTVTSANLANGKSEGTAELGTLRTTSYGVDTINATFASTTYSIQAGQTKTIAKVNLNATTKDILVNGFTLSKKGGTDFDKAFGKIEAYYNNQKVGKVTVSSDRIIVSDLNIEKKEGATVSVELKADGIFIGTATAPILINFDALSDIDVIETETKEAMQIVAPLTAIPNISVTLASVNFDVTKVSTGNQTVAPNTQDIMLYNAKIEASTDFDVVAYEVKLVAGANLNDFSSNRVKLVVDGTPIYLTTADTNYAPLTKTWTFDDKDLFTVTAGHPAKVQIIGNAKDTAAGAYQFSFEAKTLRDPENTSNTMPAGMAAPLAGDTTTIAAGGLALKNATLAGPVSRNVWASDDIELSRFSLKASAEEITVSRIAFINTTAGTAPDLNNIVSSAKLVNAKTNEVIATNGKYNAKAVEATPAICKQAAAAPAAASDPVVACGASPLANAAAVTAANDIYIDTPATTDVAGILFDGINLVAPKDETLNVKLVVTTKGFGSTELSKDIELTPVILDDNTNRASGGASVVTSTFASATLAYTTNVKSPELNITKKSDGVFEVNVKNTDSSNDITLASITAQVKSNDNTFVGYFGARLVGANDVFSTNGVSKGAKVLNNAAIAGQVVEHGDSEGYTFEIAVSSDYNMATGLSLHVTQLNWTSPTGSETYDLTVSE